MSEPCTLHEMANCSYCNGAEKRLAESLEEPRVDRGSAPYIPGGVTIFSRYPGTCAGCGRQWDVNEAIHHPRDGDGWYGVGCCFSAYAG